MDAAPSPEARQPVRAQLRTLLRALNASKARRGLLWVVAALVAAICANAVGQIRLNAWQGDFFDALERRALEEFLRQILVFLAIVAVLLVLVVSQTWLTETLKLRLRDWLTGDLLDLWLAPAHPYRLRLAGAIGTNPDQRVHEDARKLTELTAVLGVGLAQSALLLVSFIGVLWALSAEVTFSLGGDRFRVPGYMVWCALAYSLGGSLLSWRFGRPLVRINEALYGHEAELRFAMVRISESAEGIALYRGEADERGRLGASLGVVIGAMRRRASGLARLTWITSGFGWGAIIAPVLVAAPGYFSGDISFGTLMMVVGAFYQVQQALRWFIDNVPNIADWRATLVRVMRLRNALERLDVQDPAADARPHIRIRRNDAPTLELLRLKVLLPGGAACIAEDDLRIGQGERVFVLGGPGAGKSTLFSAIAGIWPWGTGEIRLPASGEMLFLPNRPYLPPGALRESLAYPARPEVVEDADIRRALEDVGLGHLAPQLDRGARWDRDLALDEQQRLAFARALLHRPAWLFMDDAASALSARAWRALMDRLAESRPGMTIVAFGRDEEDAAPFARCVRVAREDAAAFPAVVGPGPADPG